MPQIREYEAPALAIKPTETGINATAAAARRIQGEYNEVGDALTATGQRIAGTVREVGDIAVKYEDHREISAGQASYAQMLDSLTKDWNETAKNSDPNDPSVAAKWREEVLQPQLEEFKKGFNTENSQKFADSKAASTEEHFFQKTAADQSTLAGIAVQKNVHTAATAMSNTAINDPSAVPFLLKNVDHSIGGMVDSSPTLGAVDAARIKSEIGEQTKAAIVRSGAIGAIQKAEDPEKAAEDWIKRYPDYISGADAKAIAGNARQQIRARNYDDALTTRRTKEAATDQSNSATAQYLVDVRSRDPKLANDPLAQKILNDPTLLKTDKNNLLNYIDRQLKPETAARLSQQTFVGLLREMRAPDADPDAVMQKAWDARLTDPGKPNSMTESDFNQFRQEVVARKTPEGAAMERDRGMFFKNYATAITGNKSYDPTVGDPKMYNAEMDARRVEADLRRKNLDPHLAYDPSSEYFLGKPERTAKWAGNMQQDLSTRASPSGQGEKVIGVKVEPATIPAAPQRTANETYQTPRGPMKWTGTGWVKP